MAMPRKTYCYHKPSEAGANKLALMRRIFNELHETIENLIPESRERSIALTQLETTAKWVMDAIILNDPKSEVVP